MVLNLVLMKDKVTQCPNRCPLQVSLQSFDITPLKSFLSIIIIMYI